jgi:cytochrome c-type biogenesis protein CcmH
VLNVSEKCGDSRPRLSAGRSPVAFDSRVTKDVRSKGSTTNLNSKTDRTRKAAKALLLCAAISALIGAGDPASRFNEIGHRMMCVCGCNQILLECNHVGCPDSDGMRNELMASVSRGDSDSLVEQGFVQKYGPTVLAAPTTKGFDRVAYILPFVALFLGFGLVVMIVRSWKNRPAPAIAGGLRPVRGAELEQFRDQAGKETDL